MFICVSVQGPFNPKLPFPIVQLNPWESSQTAMERYAGCGQAPSKCPVPRDFGAGMKWASGAPLMSRMSLNVGKLRWKVAISWRKTTKEDEAR